MCSITDENFGDDDGNITPSATQMRITSRTPYINLDQTPCKKCNHNAAVVKPDLRNPQCAHCFSIDLRHKFRASLGSTKLVPRGSRVLVVYDCTASASVLLSMLSFAISQDKYRKLNIDPAVIFVDENCLRNDLNANERNEHLTEIKELLKQFSIKSYYTTLTKGIPIIAEIDDFEITSELLESERNIIEVINGIKTLTSRQDFLFHLKNKLLRNCAEKLHCKFVFTPEIGSDMAIKLLSNIALGRGTSVALDVAFCDNRSNVTILRPIRDISPEEISYYITLNDIKCQSNKSTKENDSEIFDSIQNLTRDFIEGLQQNFVSTVSTVFRTGNKIASVAMNSHRHILTNSDNIQKNICKLCGSGLESVDSATLLATEFSRCVNILPFDVDSKHLAAPTESVLNSSMLCHSCSNAFRDVDDQSDLISLI